MTFTRKPPSQSSQTGESESSTDTAGEDQRGWKPGMYQRSPDDQSSIAQRQRSPWLFAGFPENVFIYDAEKDTALENESVNVDN